MPFPECAAVEIGCEEAALLGGPEARPELPTLLNAGVVEEELRTARRALGRAPWQVDLQGYDSQDEGRPLMGEARAITDDVRLGAGGVTA